MNKELIKFALEANLINYVEHETPRHYFVSANADIDNVMQFAKLIIEKCGEVTDDYVEHGIPSSALEEFFGIIYK
jgi:hypothetical protein